MRWYAVCVTPSSVELMRQPMRGVGVSMLMGLTIRSVRRSVTVTGGTFTVLP